jgi:hypothetical protein
MSDREVGFAVRKIFASRDRQGKTGLWVRELFPCGLVVSPSYQQRPLGIVTQNKSWLRLVEREMFVLDWLALSSRACPGGIRSASANAHRYEDEVEFEATGAP